MMVKVKEVQTHQLFLFAIWPGPGNRTEQATAESS
jgi:hypothetical protein